MAKLYKYSIELLILISLIISILFYINFNKGIELSDESYLLLISLYPEEIIGRANNSGIIGNLLLKITDFNIYYFRLLGATLLFLVSVSLINPISNFSQKTLNLKAFKKKYLFTICILGTLNYYHNWVITPSYDLYNLIGILLFLGGIIKLIDISSINSKFLFPIILVVLGGLITFICKPTTSFFLIITYIFWVIYFFNLRRGIFIFFLSSVLSLLVFYIYVSIFFQNINLFLNDLNLGIELKVLLDPRYSLLDNFISIIKQILFYYYTNFFYIIIFLVSLFFSKILIKNHFKSLAIFLIFLPLYFSDGFLLTLLFVILYYILFDLHLTKIFFIKKNEINFLFYNFILIFLSYAYLVGTNTNAVILLKKASIIIFLIILNFIIKYNFKSVFFFKKIDLFFVILIMFTLKNLFYNFEKPRRYSESIYHQNKKISLTNFNGHIYVDNTTFKFINDLNEILLEHSWKNDNYLIDLTGREPGLNIVTGAKFVSDPWWGSGYVGSENKAAKLLSISKIEVVKRSWIISTDSQISLNPTILQVINLDINKNYQLIGTINKKSKNYFVWKPK